MSRSTAWSRLGWPLLLVLVLGFAGSDFVRHPFLPFQPHADAAEPHDGLRLSVPGSEADGSVFDVARALAATMNAAPDQRRRPARRQTAAERMPGATTTAVESVLGVGEGSEHRLLVLTPPTLVQLQRDRGETIVPGVAVRAERAWRQMVRATPVAVIAADPLVLAVPRDSPFRSVAQLSHAIRATPRRYVFGVENDSWTRAALASLVRGSGVAGTIAYRPLASARDAATAATDGTVDVVISTRAAAASAPSPGLRTLRGRWPGDHAPARWIAVVAAPGMPSATVTRLRARIGRAVRGRRWGRALRHHGLRRPGTERSLRSFLEQERRSAADLNATLASVDISAGR